MSSSTLYSTFFVKGHRFGVPVSEVQEVMKAQEMTPVPRSSPVVEGLINLRGQIIIALDLRRRLGFERRGADESSMNVVIRTENGPISLIADSIGDVLEVGEEVLDKRPDTVTGACAELVTSVAKLRGGLLLLLDTPKAVQIV